MPLSALSPVFNACLTLLTQQARERPLVLIADDLLWIDRPSATALGFVARRVHGAGVGVITASRPEDGDLFARSGLPLLHVTRAASARRGYWLPTRRTPPGWHSTWSKPPSVPAGTPTPEQLTPQ